MKVWVKTEEFSEGKFLVTRRDGTTPDWPHFVIGARDPVAPHALKAYAVAAEGVGMDHEFVSSVHDLANDFWLYANKNGDGDPDAAPHRADLPLAIGMMRHNLQVKDIAMALERIAALASTGTDEALPRIHAIANILLMGNMPKSA